MVNLKMNNFAEHSQRCRRHANPMTLVRVVPSDKVDKVRTMDTVDRANKAAVE